LLPALPTGLAVAAAVPFALFTKPIFVQTRAAQFRAHLSSRRSFPAYLAIAAAIAFASFAELILVFASATQLLALSSAASDPDAARSNLN
jgi:hypothetical protein